METNKCEFCSAELTKEYSNQKYCSRECYNKAKYERNKHNRKPSFYDAECIQCGSQFKTKDKRTKFCSKECVNESQKRPIELPKEWNDPLRILDRTLGYVRIKVPEHKEANTWGYVYEHRIIAEKILGRDLLEGEIVKHKNGKRWDNSEENLEIVIRK